MNKAFQAKLDSDASLRADLDDLEALGTKVREQTEERRELIARVEELGQTISRDREAMQQKLFHLAYGGVPLKELAARVRLSPQRMSSVIRELLEKVQAQPGVLDSLQVREGQAVVDALHEGLEKRRESESSQSSSEQERITAS